ncbi:MAG: nucleotide exchange factor GrpE [Anaerolineae bacterium]|nr:nucleotide exchange factor GrpE [Anaerolineae bacterium]
MFRALRNLFARPRFLLHLFFFGSGALLALSLLADYGMGVQLPIARELWMAVFGFLLLLEAIPLVNKLVRRMLDEEGAITRRRVTAAAALFGVVALPLASVVIGDPAVAALIYASYIAFLWSLFWTVREKLDAPVKRTATLLANAMTLAPFVALGIGYFTPPLLATGQGVLVVVELLLYTVVLFIINNRPEPKPELPIFIVRSGRMYVEGDPEDITPGNWAKRYKKEDKRTKEEKDANKPRKVVGEAVCRPDTALVVDVDGRNPRIIRANSGDRKVYAGDELRAVIDLRTQVRVNPEGVQVLTKDSIHIRIGVGASFHITRQPSASLNDDPYPATDEALFDAVYKAGVSRGKPASWDDGPLGVTAGVLRNIMQGYSIDDLFYDPKEGAAPPRKIIADKLRAGVAPALAGRGITLEGVFLLDFDLDTLEEKMRTQWIEQRKKRLEQKLAGETVAEQAGIAQNILRPLFEATANVNLDRAGAQAAADPGAVVALREQLEDAKLEAAHSKAGQRQTERRLEDAMLGALRLLDDVDRGVANINERLLNVQPKAVAYAYTKAFEVLQRKMLAYFEECELEEIPAEAGQPFDPNLHEAVKYDPTSRQPHGHISHVEQRGYQYKGKMLRPARVWVSGGRQPGQEDSF